MHREESATNGSRLLCLYRSTTTRTTQRASWTVHRRLQEIQRALFKATGVRLFLVNYVLSAESMRVAIVTDRFRP